MRTGSRCSPELRDGVIEHGHVQVVAPDGDADFIWTESGAQPFSLWLPGSIKLGFDPKAETGIGYLERVRRSEAAFHDGLGGLCRLARADAAEIVLRHDGPLLGAYDVRPSAPYRNGPEHRTAASLQRDVAPYIVYDDRNQSEVLTVFPGAMLPIGSQRRGQVRRRAARADVPGRVRVAEPHAHVPRRDRDPAGAGAARAQLVPTPLPDAERCPRGRGDQCAGPHEHRADHRLRGRPGVPGRGIRSGNREPGRGVSRG